MSEKYFIGIRPQTNEFHSIHKEDCPFLPDAGKRIYLGMFPTPFDAVNEGKKHFSMSNNCFFCSKDHHQHEKEPVFSEVNGVVNFILTEKVNAVWESAFQCSVN